MVKLGESDMLNKSPNFTQSVARVEIQTQVFPKPLLVAFTLAGWTFVRFCQCSPET